MNESVDRRILGAFVCVDAITGASVVNPMTVTSPQWRVKPNRSGIYVIFDGPGFRPLTTQFLPDASWPQAPTSFEVTLQDPSRRYLPRRAMVKAPLKVPAIASSATASATNPAAVAALQDSTSVFDPQEVPLYPAPSAPVGPGWAVIHVSVTGASGAGLPWAVLQFTRGDTSAVTTCQADASGEALLAVPGIPISAVQTSATTTGGPVTSTTIAVTVTAYFDPAIPTPAGWIPDTDAFNISASTVKSSSQSVQLGAGQELAMIFSLPV